MKHMLKYTVLILFGFGSKKPRVQGSGLRGLPRRFSQLTGSDPSRALQFMAHKPFQHFYFIRFSDVGTMEWRSGRQLPHFEKKFKKKFVNQKNFLKYI
jgi:hypothetical protein